MKDRAAFIRNAVARGISNIDDIRLEYNIYSTGGNTNKLIFLKTLDLALKKNQRYNTPEWRLYLIDLADRESSYRQNVVNSIGAKGWFQLMGSYGDFDTKNSISQFEKMFALTDSNLSYLKKNMTKDDLIKALLLGITIYDLARASHLGGAKNALKALRGQSNAKDINGTSVLDYMKGSKKSNAALREQGFIPILDNTGIDLQQQPIVTIDEIIQNAAAFKPATLEEDILATAEVPEVTVIGHKPQANPFNILPLIQENAPTPLVLEPYQIPLILNKVNEIATLRNSFLQKDLEDRILAEERRRRLGYSYKDSSLEDDIRLMLFLRNMSANGGNLFEGGGDIAGYNEEEDTYDAGTLPTTYVTPYGNFNATLYPWLSALLTRSLQYDEVNPLLGDNESLVKVKSIINGKPGRLNTAVIAPEWILEATRSARKGGYDPALAVALMSRESTIGNPTDGPSTARIWGETSLNILKLAGIDPYKTIQHIGAPFDLAEKRRLIRLNNINDYPYALEPLAFRYNTLIGNHNYNEKFPYYTIYNEAINNVGLDREAIENWLKEHYTAKDFNAVPTNPIIDALDYYKTGNYNSGWSGLYPAVRREYKEVTNNPLIMGIINNTKSRGGRLFEDGGDTTYADDTWHENWLRNRLTLFNENLNSASAELLSVFKEYNTDTIDHLLENLKNSIVLTDPEQMDLVMGKPFGYTLRAAPEYNGFTYLGDTTPNGGSYIYIAPKGPKTDSSVRGVKQYGSPWETYIHEGTHALVQPTLGKSEPIEPRSPQEVKILAINEEMKDNLYSERYSAKEPLIAGDYYERPTETLAELYRSRAGLGLKPNYKVLKEDVLRWRAEGKLPYGLARFSDDVLVRYYNEVADNNTPVINDYGIPRNNIAPNITALGGPIANMFFTGGPVRRGMPKHPKNREKDPEAYADNEQWMQEMQQDEKHYQEQAKIYREEKAKRNAQAAEEFNRQKDTIMSGLELQANSIPFTSEAYKSAVDEQRQKDLDKAKNYEKGAKAVITAAELGLSGASLLGAYANWRNWANAANLTKRGIANLLQKAQAPMQEAGTLIDAYQTMDAMGNNDFDTYYNGASGLLGVAGTIGASDIFRGRHPYVDRTLDALGIIQNTGDYLKFGYDTFFGSPDNKKALGGPLNTYLDTNSYEGGGDLLGGVRKGSIVDIDQCAQWSNGLLRNNGYLINGNAWNLGNVDTLFNGFEGLEKPEAYDRKIVEDYNHAAADSVYRNFDSKTLDTSRPYVVNMYYNDSPAQEEAFNDGKGVTGTHTGVLTYDEPSKSWLVTHNIHGRIYLEPFISLQSGKGKYGVTAVYEPRRATLWNRAKGFFGFNNGGYLNL